MNKKEDRFILSARGIDKRFGGVQALRNVDLNLRAEEVLGLVGDNGAGKSTLIKIFTGAYVADGGEIFVDGRKVEIRSPVDAHRLGIEALYQDLALLRGMDVARNIFLGREEVNKLGFLRRRKMMQESRRALQTVGITLKSSNVPAGLFSGGEQQAIAIARALYWKARVLIMDEPTAALGAVERGKVYKLIENAKANGVGLIFISHNLEDVFAVCDRIQVLRLGEVVEVFEDSTAVTPEEVVTSITGAVVC